MDGSIQQAESESQALQRRALQSTFCSARIKRETSERVVERNVGQIAMVLVRMFAEDYAREMLARADLERMRYEIPARAWPAGSEFPSPDRCNVCGKFDCVCAPEGFDARIGFVAGGAS